MATELNAIVCYTSALGISEEATKKLETEKRTYQLLSTNMICV